MTSTIAERDLAASDELLDLAKLSGDRNEAKRFRAVAALLRGQSLKSISANLGVDEKTALRLKLQFDLMGIKGLQKAVQAVETLQAEIQQEADEDLRKRLQVVQFVISGNQGKEAAKAFGISRTTVTKWISSYKEGGIEKLKPRRLQHNGQPRRSHRKPLEG